MNQFYRNRLKEKIDLIKMSFDSVDYNTNRDSLIDYIDKNFTIIPDPKPLTLDEALDRFKGYIDGQNGFDEAEFKKWLDEYNKSSIIPLPPTTPTLRPRPSFYRTTGGL